MNVTKSVLFLTLLATATYFVPTQEARAASIAECKAWGDACGRKARNALIACAAGAIQEGKNKITDIACGTLAEEFGASVPECLGQARACAAEGRPQPQTSIIPSGNIGSIATWYDQTIACPGSHRITGLAKWSSSANASTSRFIIACSNGTQYGAGTSRTGDSKYSTPSCGDGKLAQGLRTFRDTSNGQFIGFRLACDKIYATDDTTVQVGNTTNGTQDVRICAEGSYLVGVRVTGNSVYVSSLEFLCRRMPV